MRILSLVVVVALTVAARPFVAAQGDVTDADLETASADRVIRIGLSEARGSGVAEIPLEVYVARVLAGEGEPKAASAAQEALAIAIRTYAAANMGRHRREGFDLCDTTHCQVLRAANATSRRAVQATGGQILLYDGHPADLYYSASCGGRSESIAEVWSGSPSFEYLRSVKDDVHEGDEPWTIELGADDIREALRKVGFEGSRVRDLDVKRRNESGRVSRLGLSGLRPDTITGADLRMAVGPTVLRSTAFTVKKTSKGFRFSGTGYGHGVGMCVIGAGRRAARGESAAAILQQYYPGLALTALNGALVSPLPPILPPEGGSHNRAPESDSHNRVPGSTAPPGAASALAAPRTSPILARVPAGTGIEAAVVERMAVAAHEELGRRLGRSVAPITIDVHPSIESFRHSTGRPWWVSAVVTGTAVDLAPPAVLAQRDGLEAAVRRGVAEVLIGSTFAGRPAWITLGAARFFARPAAVPPAVPRNLRCPTDPELRMAVSATAQREAEGRAEACFARAVAGTNDWRAVR